MNQWVKFLAAVLLFSAWLVLVLLHFAPAQSLIDAIGYTLAGLGIYHAATGNSPAVAALIGGVEGQQLALGVSEPMVATASAPSPANAVPPPVAAQSAAPGPAVQ